MKFFRLKRRATRGTYDFLVKPKRLLGECLALYLTLRTSGYAAWERIKEVSDTTGNLKEWRQSYWLLNESELCLDAL